MGSFKKLIVFCFVMASLATTSIATMADDEKECADQLANLAACIPYVSGTAKKPTPECCQDTQKLKATKPKCLCVLIKESTDQSMGLPINTTLALQMPTACNIDTTVSNCPTLLNIPADSPDAKIFKEATGSSSKNSTTDDSSPTSSGTTTSSSSATDNSKATASTSTSSSDGAKLMLFAEGSLLMMVASYALTMLII